MFRVWVCKCINADAAYDAWYVYEAAARHDGSGAVPLNQHSATSTQRDADATPRCARGLRMTPTTQFDHTYGYRAQRFRCPLLFPEKTGETCNHEQFAKGKSCVKDIHWELGGRKPRDPGSGGTALSRHLHPAHLL